MTPKQISDQLDVLTALQRYLEAARDAAVSGAAALPPPAALQVTRLYKFSDGTVVSFGPSGRLPIVGREVALAMVAPDCRYFFVDVNSGLVQFVLKEDL